MTKKANCKTDIESLKRLTESYFEATISEEETLLLLEAALDADSLTITSPEDERLQSDLRMILAINALPVPECTDMPDGLNARLENHISRIAGSSRSITSRWIKATIAVAAVMTGIIVCAISFLRPAEMDSIASADSMQIIPELNLSIPQENTSQLAESVALPESHSKAIVIPASPTPKIAKSVTSVKNVSLSESSPKKIVIPGIEEITRIDIPNIHVAPVLATANIDPMSRLVSPLTTVSSSMDCVYESLGVVQSALSGVKASFGEASDELITAATVTLRSI